MRGKGGVGRAKEGSTVREEEVDARKGDKGRLDGGEGVRRLEEKGRVGCWEKK